MENILLSELSFTSFWWCLLVPLILIILDILTGLVNAWKDGNFKSAIMRAGLSKKFGEIVYILVGLMTKYALGTEVILYFLVGYICLMEISSLLENCDKLGVKIPEKIKDKINNLDEKTSEKEKSKRTSK